MTLATNAKCSGRECRRRLGKAAGRKARCRRAYRWFSDPQGFCCSRPNWRHGASALTTRGRRGATDTEERRQRSRTLASPRHCKAWIRPPRQRGRRIGMSQARWAAPIDKGWPFPSGFVTGQGGEALRFDRSETRSPEAGPRTADRLSRNCSSGAHQSRGRTWSKPSCVNPL